MNHHTKIFWSEEDGGFIATAPDLPGCSAFGETPQEALAELQDAIAAWTEAAHAAGNPVPNFRTAVALLVFLVGAWFYFGTAEANQSNTWSPTTGTVTGLQLTTNYNNAFSAIQSCNSGNSAPANDQTAAAVVGQCWLNTTSNPYPVSMYDGTGWNVLGWLDTSAHLWIANNGGGTGTVASATTTDLCTAKNPVQAVSGTVTITSFGSTCGAGTQKFLNFTGILALTHNGTSLILPTAANITTVAGDTAIAVALGSGNWRVVSYQRASGVPLASSATFTGSVNFDGIISPAALASNTYDWAPTGLATANVIRLSCSSVINIGGITAPVVDGQVLVLNNVGATNNCVFTAQDANDSTAANRFAFDRAIALRPGRTLTIKYDATTARWVRWDDTPPPAIMGGFKNLRLLNVTNAAGDTAPVTPNNQYKVALDEITLEDTNGAALRVNGSVNVVDVSGTAAQNPYVCVADVTASGAGGLDTGAVAASTWYYVWVIAQPSGITTYGTGTVSCMFSISATAPTMPSGYTYKARVGAIPTDASGNKCLYRVQQYGRHARYVATGANAGCSANNSLGAILWNNANTAGANIGFTSPVLVSTPVAGNGLPVPSTASRLSVYLTTIYKGGGGAGGIIVAPSQAYSGTNNGVEGSNGLQGAIQVGTGSASQSQWTPIWLTLESANLSIASTGTTSSAISIMDWEDNLN